MTLSYEVRVWDLRKVARKGRPVRYEARWKVEAKEHSKTFAHKAQADHYRAGLLTAAKAGEPFDVETGQPAGSSRGAGPTCYEVAQEMVAKKWPDAAAKSRQTEVDNLAYLLCALVPTNRDVADGVRLAVRATLGRTDVEPTTAQQDHLRWLTRASMPITLVTDTVVRRVLEKAGVKADGTPYSDSIRRQRRIYLSGLLTYAVEQKHIRENPVAQVKAPKAESTVVQEVNARQIGSVTVARSIIEAMPEGLYQDFAAMELLAGTRPSEAAALRVQDCALPETGWGELTLAKSSATSGKAWTDSGEVRDSRGLKHRRKSDRRTVPVPPELVAILRARIGQRKNGWVFEPRPGHQLSDVSVGRAWAAAREIALPGDEETLARVYDLRHLAASTWLNAGVPVTEVAARLGHSAAVCLQVYAHVITTERPRWNAVIEAAIGGGE